MAGGFDRIVRDALLAAQEPLIVGRLTVVSDDAESRRRAQTSIATSSPDREPHKSGDRPQMVVYRHGLKTRLPGDALYAEEDSRNRLRYEADIGGRIRAATDRTEERICRREAAVPAGADGYEIGAERHGIGAE